MRGTILLFNQGAERICGYKAVDVIGRMSVRRLYAPGIARENFFLEMAELRRSGRTLTPEEMTAFYARHDQVMVDP